MPTLRRYPLMIAAVVLAAACTDQPVTEPEKQSDMELPGARQVVAAVSCTASLEAETVACQLDEGVRHSREPSLAIVGGQGVNVELTSSNVHYDDVNGVFFADVTVQNLMIRPLGTPDGTTVTGVRVFFHSGPTVTDGSGDVTVRNADGTGSFTGSDQPYHEYAEMLTTGETTEAKTWEWDVPSSVLTFEFEVYVEADRPNTPPTAAISTPLNGATYELGETVTFSGSATDPEDGTLTGSALVWTSNVEFGQQIGTGESFSRDDLGAGHHRIVLTATDSDGATDTDTVEITVYGNPVPGLWQTATTFGGYAFEVNPSSSGITEITYYLDDLYCGDYGWYGIVPRSADGVGWPITAGSFSIENQLASVLEMTVEGFFKGSDWASTWWEAVSGVTHCSQVLPPVAKPATRLFLRYDGTQTFLSRNPAPPGESWYAQFPAADSYANGMTYEWPANLDVDLDGEIYTFAGYLRATSSAGNFLFRVWVDHGGTEKNLASHRFEVSATSEDEGRAATDDGVVGGVAGDRLMVRVTYWGGGPGELHFGYGRPTHVIVPGHITVSTASAVATSVPSDAITISSDREGSTRVEVRYGRMKKP